MLDCCKVKFGFKSFSHTRNRFLMTGNRVEEFIECVREIVRNVFVMLGNSATNPFCRGLTFYALALGTIFRCSGRLCTQLMCVLGLLGAL